MTPPKQRGKIRRINIYPKEEDQTYKYIYYKIAQDDSTKNKGGRSDGQIYILQDRTG